MDKILNVIKKAGKIAGSILWVAAIALSVAFGFYVSNRLRRRGLPNTTGDLPPLPPDLPPDEDYEEEVDQRIEEVRDELSHQTPAEKVDRFRKLRDQIKEGE